MTQLVMRRGIGLWALAASVCMAASAADIYRSEQPDGLPRYASEPLDATYVLYLKGETQTSAGGQTPTAPVPANGKRAALATLIVQLARQHAVEPALVQAIIDTESHFDPLAHSPKGAVGAMQLMPATAARYGVRQRTDPAQNIDAGIRHLKYLLALHNGNLVLALAAYNAGEGTVRKHGQRIPPYRETMLYVPAVLARLQAAGGAATPVSVHNVTAP